MMSIPNVWNKAQACIVLVAAACLACSCESAYYRTLEALGKHKRDLLVERVVAARDGQAEAKEQFQTALERFAAVVKFEGGDLQAKYDELKAELDHSEAKAQAVTKQIADVRDVSSALFTEWESELARYSDDDLRLSSEVTLRETQMRYAQLLRAMTRAERKMEPVLAAFRDQVLFLKHNLNALAVASLGGTVGTLETEMAALVAEMEASIREANGFIAAMGKP